MARMTGDMEAIRKQYSSLNATVQESISGIRLVKSFMRYDRELEKFSKGNIGLNDARNRAMRVWVAFMQLFGGWMGDPGHNQPGAMDAI